MTPIQAAEYIGLLLEGSSRGGQPTYRMVANSILDSQQKCFDAIYEVEKQYNYPHSGWDQIKINLHNCKEVLDLWFLLGEKRGAGIGEERFLITKKPIKVIFPNGERDLSWPTPLHPVNPMLKIGVEVLGIPVEVLMIRGSIYNEIGKIVDAGASVVKLEYTDDMASSWTVHRVQ